MHWTQEKPFRTADARVKVNKNIKTVTPGLQDKEEHMPATGDSSQVCCGLRLLLTVPPARISGPAPQCSQELLLLDIYLQRKVVWDFMKTTIAFQALLSYPINQ